MSGVTSLPNSRFGRTTETVGFFETDVHTFARWQTRGLGHGWEDIDIGQGSVEALIDKTVGVERTPRCDKYLILAAGRWSMLFTDGPLGTDTGVLPARAASDLRVRGVRATAVDSDSDSFAAAIVDLFDPDADDASGCLRSVHATHDGYSWTFGQYGEPLEFEDVDAYQRRAVRQRFTAAMVREFLAHLGIPDIGLEDTTTGRLVSRSS